MSTRSQTTLAATRHTALRQIEYGSVRYPQGEQVVTWHYGPILPPQQLQHLAQCTQTSFQVVSLEPAVQLLTQLTQQNPISAATCVQLWWQVTHQLKTLRTHTSEPSEWLLMGSQPDSVLSTFLVALLHAETGDSLWACLRRLRIQVPFRILSVSHVDALLVQLLTYFQKAQKHQLPSRSWCTLQLCATPYVYSAASPSLHVPLVPPLPGFQTTQCMPLLHQLFCTYPVRPGWLHRLFYHGAVIRPPLLWTSEDAADICQNTSTEDKLLPIIRRTTYRYRGWSFWQQELQNQVMTQALYTGWQLDYQSGGITYSDLLLIAHGIWYWFTVDVSTQKLHMSIFTRLHLLMTTWYTLRPLTQLDTTRLSVNKWQHVSSFPPSILTTVHEIPLYLGVDPDYHHYYAVPLKTASDQAYQGALVHPFTLHLDVTYQRHVRARITLPAQTVIQCIGSELLTTANPMTSEHRVWGEYPTQCQSSHIVVWAHDRLRLSWGTSDYHDAEVAHLIPAESGCLPLLATRATTRERANVIYTYSKTQGMHLVVLSTIPVGGELHLWVDQVNSVAHGH